MNATFIESLTVQVLREPGCCLHVQLSAVEGIGLHAKSDRFIGDSQAGLREGHALPEQAEPAELLSGFVSYEQVANAMDSSLSRFTIFKKTEDKLLSLKGPGKCNCDCMIAS